MAFPLPFHQIWIHRFPGQIHREAAPGGLPTAERQNHSEGRREGDDGRQVHRCGGPVRVEGDPGGHKGWGFRYKLVEGNYITDLRGPLKDQSFGKIAKFHRLQLSRGTGWCNWPRP